MKEFSNVCYKYTHRLSLLEKAIEAHKALREPCISSWIAQMKKRTRVTSADIGVSVDWSSAKLSRKRLVFDCKYDQNVKYVDTLMTLKSQPLKGLPHLHHCTTQALPPCVPRPQESPLEQMSSPSVQLPCPAARLPLASSAHRTVIPCSDIYTTNKECSCE